MSKNNLLKKMTATTTLAFTAISPVTTVLAENTEAVAPVREEVAAPVDAAVKAAIALDTTVKTVDGKETLTGSIKIDARTEVLKSLTLVLHNKDGLKIDTKALSESAKNLGFDLDIKSETEIHFIATAETLARINTGSIVTETIETETFITIDAASEDSEKGKVTVAEGDKVITTETIAENVTPVEGARTREAIEGEVVDTITDGSGRQWDFIRLPNGGMIMVESIDADANPEAAANEEVTAINHHNLEDLVASGEATVTTDPATTGVTRPNVSTEDAIESPARPENTESAGNALDVEPETNATETAGSEKTEAKPEGAETETKPTVETTVEEGTEKETVKVSKVFKPVTLELTGDLDKLNSAEITVISPSGEETKVEIKDGIAIFTPKEEGKYAVKTKLTAAAKADLSLDVKVSGKDTISTPITFKGHMRYDAIELMIPAIVAELEKDGKNYNLDLEAHAIAESKEDKASSSHVISAPKAENETKTEDVTTTEPPSTDSSKTETSSTDKSSLETTGSSTATNPSTASSSSTSASSNNLSTASSSTAASSDDTPKTLPSQPLPQTNEKGTATGIIGTIVTGLGLAALAFLGYKARKEND